MTEYHETAIILKNGLINDELISDSYHWHKTIFDDRIVLKLVNNDNEDYVLYSFEFPMDIYDALIRHINEV